jgi:hypothetical protein
MSTCLNFIISQTVDSYHEQTGEIGVMPTKLCVRYLVDRSLLPGDTRHFFAFGATAPVWALAYLHETLRFTLVY